MKATEFVEKYGWDYAKHILTNDAPLVMDLNYTDLQTLVNAYEFVSAHRSIEVAKKYCDLHDTYETSNHYNNLRAKIKLVESVNE